LFLTLSLFIGESRTLTQENDDGAHDTSLQGERHGSV
jgi:hypothetical protein